MKKALFILISFLLLVQSVFSASAPTEKELNDLREALFTGNAEYVENFLRSYPYIVNNIKFGEDGRTALMIAAQVGHTDVISVLLKNKADVNAKTNVNGQTALISAISGGHTDVVSLLIENGADVNAEDNDGWTASMFAAQNGHTEVVSVLLKNGAD